MMDAWSTNTFLARKQLANPFLWNSQTPFLDFLTFSSNKCWWWLPHILLFGRHTFLSHLALPPKGRLWQLATPLGTFVRELSHLIYVQHLSWPFLLFCFPLFFYVLIFIWLFFYVVMLSVVVCLLHAYLEIFVCSMRTWHLHLCTHSELFGPIPEFLET